jgi:hypothetical protein
MSGENETASRAWWIVVLLLIGCILASLSMAAISHHRDRHFTDALVTHLQTISFLVVVMLILGFIFQRSWNVLSRDLPLFRVLSYKRSLTIIVGASMLCVLVLTTIVGARQFVTPVWTKSEAVPRFDPQQQPQAWLEQTRRRGMEQFRSALWEHAARHEGRLPEDPFAAGAGIADASWRSPDPAGTPYVYLLRREKKVPSSVLPAESRTMPAADNASYLLACEPRSFGQKRFVLFTTGEILKLSASQLAARVDEDSFIDSEIHRKATSQP